jgi:hypothetical protein
MKKMSAFNFAGIMTISVSILGFIAATGMSACQKNKQPFDEDSIVVEDGSTAEAVDLGLSVKWASHNVGATKPEEYGTYFGWGDTTGKKTSQNNDEYPNANPPKNICGTEYDAAHVLWGGSWRMPTKEQAQDWLITATGKKPNRTA